MPLAINSMEGWGQNLTIAENGGEEPEAEDIDNSSQEFTIKVAEK